MVEEIVMAGTFPPTLSHYLEPFEEIIGDVKEVRLINDGRKIELRGHSTLTIRNKELCEKIKFASVYELYLYGPFNYSKIDAKAKAKEDFKKYSLKEILRKIRSTEIENIAEKIDRYVLRSTIKSLTETIRNWYQENRKLCIDILELASGIPANQIEAVYGKKTIDKIARNNPHEDLICFKKYLSSLNIGRDKGIIYMDKRGRLRGAYVTTEKVDPKNILNICRPRRLKYNISALF